jgi:hypothetical protein
MNNNMVATLKDLFDPRPQQTCLSGALRTDG